MADDSNIDRHLEAISQSVEFHDWRERLAACFYDKERKAALIREARESIAARSRELTADEVEAIQRAVIGQLIGFASQAASRPVETDELAISERAPEEIEDLVIERFPYPIAACYRRLTEAESSTGAFGCLLDTFESLLHYLATIALSVYWREGTPDANHNRRLLEKFYKGKWSAGILMELLRETVRLYLDRPGALPYPQMLGYLFTKNGKPGSSLAVLSGFVDLRNEVWGHKGGRDDRFYAAIVGENRRRLEEELNRSEWLTGCALWLPKEVDDKGMVNMADLLNGDRRRKNREVSLRLDPKDLDINGGDIIPERTLLLVNEATGDYLPLFPLSLFHFHQSGQGLFFLNDLDWANKAERLKRARYLAYDLVSADGKGNLYEARAGEFAANSLEAKVRHLAGAIQGEGASLDEMKRAVREVEDYDLPEVWAEQSSHLKTFAGRDAWIERLGDWADSSDEGGYFLLLGPPGQGKSALMGQFAHHRASERGGCLLHMVKSHKNPRRFLQFLLWQTGALIGEPLSEAVYQGDVEDLRNSLVGVLESMVKKHGRALMVIDALDELDHSGERIAFLPEHLPAGVSVVLSCRPEIPLVSALERRLRPLQTEHLPPLSAEDLPLFLDRYAETELAQILREAVDFDALFDRTQGNPLFLKRAMECILDEAGFAREQGSTLGAIDVSAFPNTVEAVFEDIYNQIAEKVNGRWTSEEGRAKARLIQLLSVSQEALSVDDLRGLLRTEIEISKSQEAGDKTMRAPSLEDARDMILQMSEYLISYDGERFLPFHQGFVDYLHSRVLGGEGVAEAHGVFCEWLNRPQQHGSLYRLSHLPFHLRECAARNLECGMNDEGYRKFDELSVLLTSFDFAQSKVRSELIFDLIRDYQSYFSALRDAGQEPSPEMDAWSRFIDGESYILAPYPQAFFQQAINQPAESPVALAAEERLGKLDSPPAADYYLRWLNKPVRMTPSPIRRTLLGHRGRVNSVVVTQDSRQAVSGGWDGTLKIWDLASGQEQATFEGHSRPVGAIVLIPDGKRAVSGGWDGTLRVWDLSTGECLAVFEKHAKLIRGIALTPCADKVVSGSDDGKLKVWDMASGECLATFEGHTGPVRAVVITPDGKRAISGSHDKTVKIWNLDDGQSLATLEGHTGPVRAIALSPDGRHLISGGRDRTLKVWNLADGKCIATLEGHSDWVSAIAFDPDGKRVASASMDRTIRMWDVTSGNCIATFEGHKGPVSAIVFTPDGKQAVSGSQDSELKVWDIDSGEHDSSLEGHLGSVIAIALTSDGKQVVTASRDRTLKLWDLPDGKCRGSYEMGHTHWINTIALTSDGKRAVVGSQNGTLRIWDMVGGGYQAILRGHTKPVREVVLSIDETFAVTCSEDKTLKVWDLIGGECLATFEGHSAVVCALALSPDGKRVVSGSRDGTLKIWDVNSGDCLTTLEGHEDWVNSIALSCDGSRAVSGSRDRTIKVWDLTNGQCLKTLKGHTGNVCDVAIAPNGKEVISGAGGGTLKVWELDTEQCLATFPASGSVRSCAVSDEGLIVCGASSGRVYILRLEQIANR